MVISTFHLVTYGFSFACIKEAHKKSWPVKSPIPLQTKFRINKVGIKGDVQLAPLDECSLDLSYSAVKWIEQVEPHNSCVIFEQCHVSSLNNVKSIILLVRALNLFTSFSHLQQIVKIVAASVLENFEFIREINHMLNGETEWVVFKAMELGGLWNKIKSINLLEISDRVNWWTVILQVSIGKQWKEFLDYNETIGFIFHDDAKKDRNAKNRYSVWLVESFLERCMLGGCFLMQDSAW